MPPTEFSERLYEFCTNYELQTALGAYLIGGVPAIPSQIEEAMAGYDAAYRLVGGRVLFFQFKVAHYAPRPWAQGAATFRLWGRPYFRASLHRDRWGNYSQHNTLVSMASAHALPLYASPCFHRQAELRKHFAMGAGTAVLDRSLLGPVAGTPLIYDTDTHSISYPDDGSAFRVHSEPNGPYEAYENLDALLARIEPSTWTTEFFVDVRDRLRSAVLEQDLPVDDVPGVQQDLGPVAEIAALLDQHVGAVMALVPTAR